MRTHWFIASAVAAVGASSVLVVGGALDTAPLNSGTSTTAHSSARVSAEATPADTLRAIAATTDGAGRVRVFVRFARGADRGPSSELIASSGGRIAHRYRLLPDLVAVRDLPAAALDELARAHGVREVLPDLERHASLVESRALMRATPAELSGFSDGAGVRVCVLDSGLNKTHPAFAGAVAIEHDFVNNDGDASDDNGHGTNVAGIIASRDPTYGGVAPGAQLAIAKVLDADGSGFDADIIAAIEWCTFDAGGDILSFNLGGGTYLGTCDFDPLAAALNASVDAGVVAVTASGNDGDLHATDSPACASRAITVGAVYDASLGSQEWCLNATCSQSCTDASTAADALVCFSNRAMKVDVVAPGSEITTPHGFSSGFESVSGTSIASPHVAGLVARLLGERPELGPNDVRRWIWRNAEDLGAVGFDEAFGHGRIDALATLSDATPVVCSTAGACDDGDPCTLDLCQSGFCAHPPACEDGDAGTVDTCDAGACSHEPVVVDDMRTCTTDTMDGCHGPVHTPANGSCNPTCALATALSIGTSVSGTTVGATKSIDSTCAGGSTNPGANVVYRLHMKPDQAVTITLTPTSNWDPSIYLLAGAGSASCDVLRCVAGMDLGLNGQAEVMQRVRVPVAGYYFLIVDTWASNSTGSFTLRVDAACDPEDQGRPCDDANECTVNDVCSSGSCEGELGAGCASDAECSDGDVCNGTETCDVGSGACVPGTPPSCDDGNACTYDTCSNPTGCVHSEEPAPSCLALPSASVQVVDKDDTKDQIKWKWVKGLLLTDDELGVPSTDATYTLCIYDSTAGSDSLAARLRVDPNSSWVDKDPGWNYKDKTGSEDGVQKIQLKPGAAGKSKAQLDAKGLNIPMPVPISATEFFDQDTRVTVQLHQTGTLFPSRCWTSEFTSATKNSGSQFKAKY